MGVGEGAAVARKCAVEAVGAVEAWAGEEAGEDAPWEEAWEAAPHGAVADPAEAVDGEVDVIDPFAEDWENSEPYYVESNGDVRRVQRGMWPLPPRELGKKGRRAWRSAMGSDFGVRELARVGQRVNRAGMFGEEAVEFIFARLSLSRLTRKIQEC